MSHLCPNSIEEEASSTDAILIITMLLGVVAFLYKYGLPAVILVLNLSIYIPDVLMWLALFAFIIAIIKWNRESGRT